MSKKLIIAEKPSVARSIANALNLTNKKDGYIEGEDWISSWALGHLVTLSMPEKYDNKYKKWNLEDLPIIPNNFKTEIINSTKKQFYVLKELINREDVSSLVCATDAGREGELIFRLIYNKINTDKPFERLWISSMEDEAIRGGFKNLKDGSQYDNLYQASICRQRADWLVGLNLTRLVTVKNNKKLTVGRVQTPTLKMIVDRDFEIENFVKQKYHTVDIDVEGFTLSTKRIDDYNEACNIKDNVNEIIEISEIEKKEKVVKPQKLYDLTTLQREANKYYNLSAKQTLDLVQTLYEKKLVTYPRTDSKYLSEDMMTTLNTILSGLDSNIEINTDNFKTLFNNNKVSDHHAIIPTELSLNCDLSDLKKDEIDIYNLIKNRVLASVSDNLVEELTTVIVKEAGEEFKASGKIIIQEGFTKYTNKDQQKTQTLPPLEKGQKLEVLNKSISDKFTSPKARYTEATLLSAMENAGKELLDSDIEIEREGLGTTATRADIIEKLIKDGYVNRNKKQLISSEVGRKLIEIVPDSVKEPKLTVDWENALSEIAQGKKNPHNFMSNVADNIKEIVSTYNISNTFKNKNSEDKLIGKCQYCGGDVYLNKFGVNCENSKFGKNKGTCKFGFPRENAGYKLTEQDCIDIVTKGESKLIKKFKSKKTNKYFPAKLKINPKEDKYTLGFVFESKTR